MKNNYRKILENHFGIYDDENSFDLEAWTNGGVDMFITIEKNKDLISQLKDYVENFNIDEEITILRESEDYRNNFTIRQSLEDFEDWLIFINDIIKELEVD